MKATRILKRLPLHLLVITLAVIWLARHWGSS